MQKKLIAAAVATMISGAAMAQVTIYGRVDVGYNDATTDTTTAGGVTTSTQITSTGANNAMTTSRLGFKIEEDLGGGLKAMGNLELGINNDAKNGADTDAALGSTAATNSFNTRLANVGLMTPIGTITIGRQTTLVDLVLQTGSTGGANNTVGELYNDGVKFNNTRSSELLTYNSPSFGGLMVNLQYGEGTTDTGVAGTTNEKSETGVSVTFANGPFSIGLGYSTEEQIAAGVVVAEPTQLAIGGSFDLKVVKVYATFMDGDDSLTTLSTDDIERKAFEIGVRVPLGAATLMASAYQGELSTQVAANDRDLEGFQLGVSYAFSKRTSVYGLYGVNESAATTGSAAVEKETLAIGVRHDF